jgi:hypothetical protein
MYVIVSSDVSSARKFGAEPEEEPPRPSPIKLIYFQQTSVPTDTSGAAQN